MKFSKWEVVFLHNKIQWSGNVNTPILSLLLFSLKQYFELVLKFKSKIQIEIKQISIIKTLWTKMIQNILFWNAKFCGATTCYVEASQIFVNFSKVFKYPK